MAALTASRDTKERAGSVINFPVAASNKVYVGSLVALNSGGYAVPAADTAGLRVIGRCEGSPPGITGTIPGSDVDNSGGSNGALTVDVKRGVFEFNNGASGEALGVGDVGKLCFALDDNTVGKAGGTNKIVAGRFLGLSSAGYAWVDTTVGKALAADVAQTQDTLTDSSGGTASTTIAAVGGTYSQSVIANAFATFAAELAKVKADVAAILSEVS